VEYLELRFLDVDPFSPLGVSEETLAVLHLFVLDGLMKPSGSGTTEELQPYLDAAGKTALADPSAFLEQTSGGSESVILLTRARERLEALRPLAHQLDSSRHARYVPVLEASIARTIDPSNLPSHRLLRAFEASGLGWTEFGMNTARTLTEGERHEMECVCV